MGHRPNTKVTVLLYASMFAIISTGISYLFYLMVGKQNLWSLEEGTMQADSDTRPLWWSSGPVHVPVCIVELVACDPARDGTRPMPAASLVSLLVHFLLTVCILSGGIR